MSSSRQRSVFEIQVEQVRGHCECGYETGDRLTCSGLNTPAQEFCGGAYMALFPMIVALNSGASFAFRDDPFSMGGLACPDGGKVVFQLRLVKESDGD